MALGGENYSSHNTEMHKALLSHVLIFSWQNRHVYKSIATFLSDLSCSKKRLRCREFRRYRFDRKILGF